MTIDFDHLTAETYKLAMGQLAPKGGIRPMALLDADARLRTMLALKAYAAKLPTGVWPPWAAQELRLAAKR